MKIIHLAETTSTMDEARRVVTDGEPTFVVAEMQTAGRGRRGNQWQSAPRAGVYGTYAFQVNHSELQLSGLSLAVGVGLLDGLKLLPWGIRLKWPNDLVHERSKRKLAGILIESASQAAITTVLVGVGLNIESSPSTETAGHPIGLKDLSSSYLSYSYEESCHQVATILDATIKKFQHEGFGGFHQAFHDCMVSSPTMTIDTEGVVRHGAVEGVSSSGALLLREGEVLHEVLSGHVISW
jgi:BirA family biotin operon repressor/biotin-[acetyl-CoA-carboxylase] ligase